MNRKRDKRIRVNLSLDPNQYRRLKDMTKRRGFRSVCAHVCILLEVYMDHVKHLEKKADSQTNEEYISAMFAELSSTERIPDGTVPVRHPRPTIS